ncbi:unnamed protein product [Adineta steineri]|uniref:Uncharacterized protein n=1 Tax=Adineta steineri TaxID=433720 RepID=A0A815C9I2_9BILA|nr:unnamed protein product [Adineta steineri]CAF1282222.1 unnamed protein product [Adineta steineri]
MGAENSVNNKNTNQSLTTLEHGLEQRRTISQKVRNSIVICLNTNTDGKTKDWQRTIAELQHTVHNCVTFSDNDQCIKFTQTLDDLKACVVIFGSVGQQFLSRIHNISQVESIFIFCDNKQRYESLTKVWSKIKGIFTDTTLICEALKQTIQHCEQNALPLSFIPSTKNLDQLDISFVYTHFIKEIILTSHFGDENIKEFTAYCRELFADNEEELTDVKEFESKYRQETPIWWYKKHCFINPMLNCALRSMNGDLLTRMGFFIADLHQQIEQSKSDSSSSTNLKVYYGQGLTKNDFEQLKKSRGGLISFNSFLLTNKNLTSSLNFAEDISARSDLVGIMFVMNIDPSQSSNYSEIKDEILFSIGTIFRINDIKRLTSSNRLQEVHLSLINEKDKDHIALMNYIRQENNSEKDGWYRFGAVLIKMNRFDKAEQVYQLLLEETKDMNKKASIYEQLGWIEDKQEKYSEAIIFYEKALIIYQQNPAINQLDLANLYYSIATAYSKIENSSKALLSHKEALKIREQLLPSDHLDLAKSYGNIGLLYVDANDSPTALSYFEKEFAINQKFLPPNHPDLVVALMDIGVLSYNTDNCTKALASFEKALEIRQKILPDNDLGLVESYNNIGLVYNRMSDQPKALLNHEKALAIREKVLPKNHPDLGESYNNIGVTYENMNNHTKACSFLERAIEVGLCSLSADDPILQLRKDNLERVKEKL